MNLTDEGVLSLSIGLQSNHTLKFLTLSHNPLTVFGLENLVDLLDVNSSLTDLDLSYT